MASPIKHIQFTRNSTPFESLDALKSYISKPDFFERLNPVPKDGQIILLRYLKPDGTVNTIDGKVYYHGGNPLLHLGVSTEVFKHAVETMGSYTDQEINKVKLQVEDVNAALKKLTNDLKSATETFNTKIEELSNLLKKHTTEKVVEAPTPTEIVFTVAPPEPRLPHMPEHKDVDMA